VCFEFGHFFCEKAEPEGGDLGEDAAFGGDAVGQNDIEGGGTVCGDEEKSGRGEGVNIADFASAKEWVCCECC